MLTIEQLRSLPDLRAKFQATTGLTWDPTSLEDEDFLKAIQWLFPKGAGFDAEHIAFDKEVIEEIGGDTSDEYYNQEGGEGGGEEPTPEPEPEPEPDPTDNDTYNTDDINSNTEVNSSDAEGNTQSGTLGDEEANLLEGEDNSGIGTNSGEQIILNNEPSSVDPQEEP